MIILSSTIFKMKPIHCVKLCANFKTFSFISNRCLNAFRTQIIISRNLVQSAKLIKPKLYSNHMFRSTRNISSSEFERKRRSTFYYICGIAVLVLGLSYAAVPMYRLFCQATSYGGQVQVGHDETKVAKMKKVKHRLIEVRFNADTASSMTWNFKPQQSVIYVSPGETALAFYTATNPTDRPITGIATYNVLPFDAGQYFNKIQCFCFEEQRLNPHEQVDMPVFFYLDPAYAEDPKLENADSIVLSYTFFEAKEGLVLPTPEYARR